MILFSISIIIVLLSQDVGIFWDNVLFASKLGNTLFSTGILNWNLIPHQIDSGHPPLLATYLAMGWKIFGKSLALSHWLMLPFIFGVLWQIFNFVGYFIKDHSLRPWGWLLVVADPTFSSQLFLVGPEVIQLFFFFLALNGTLRKNYCLKAIGLAVLGLVTYRGMMLCAGIFLIDLIIHTLKHGEHVRTFFVKKNALTYLTGSLPAITYILWRLMDMGWVFSNPYGNWGDHFHHPTYWSFYKNILLNIIISIHRFSDFGRVVLILFVLVTLFIKRKSILKLDSKVLIVITIFSSIIILVLSLFINNSIGHRYFIPSYLSMALLSFLLISFYNHRKLIYIGLLGSLLLGNFIIYPDRIAQGWDSSLAHLPYWKLRQEAIKYMDESDIPVSRTATFFPNVTSIDNISLNGDHRSFIDFNRDAEFVLYSNVYNLSDTDLMVLAQHYKVLWSREHLGVRVVVLRSKLGHR